VRLTPYGTAAKVACSAIVHHDVLRRTQGTRCTSTPSTRSRRGRPA
jgi:hypothetical protein